jgi:choline dehydrogenase-like flavoprotein
VALGNAGWGFEDVLPCFARLEADADFGDQPWHGDRGLLPITRDLDVELTEIAAAGLQAVQAVGFPMVEDHNRPGAVGAGRMPMSSRDGIRVTTADAYLPVGRTPPNLTIRPDTHVADVAFDRTRARGVRLLDGKRPTARRPSVGENSVRRAPRDGPTELPGFPQTDPSPLSSTTHDHAGQADVVPG